ncbi:uncharacterized protein PHACADRAFT_65298, partial [Phanerochaete carnosa HHB-10118-sp]
DQADKVLQLDEFKVEYHPDGEISACTYQFDEYHREQLTTLPPAKLLEFVSRPWHLFRCRDNFEFSEVILEAGMSQQQISCLLAVVECIKSGSSDFSFATHKDTTPALLVLTTDLLCIYFGKYTISAIYNQQEHLFDVHAWPLWEWVLNQVKSPLFTSFSVILSVDKAKLSRFGMQNEYPVIAQIANLDVETQNGRGSGGGHIV